MALQSLRFSQRVEAPVAEVFRAFTRATGLREWLCDAALADARVGGRLYVWWNSGYHAMGEFTALEPGAGLSFNWRGKGEPASTEVTVRLEEARGGTQVELEHAGLGSSPEWQAVREQVASGWRSGLENLASVLETGEDQRTVRRPMLGITVAEFNEDVAAKLGVPVTEGCRLDGVIEGMGAQRAGLRKDDVIVALNGKDAAAWPAMTNALQGLKAGDTVIVDLYRGEERLSLPMELSHRPMPEVPATPAALAEAVRKIHEEGDQEIGRCFEGVTEAEASRQPAPGEWSALEVVAHFIAEERENQAWITDLINDDERWSDRLENATNTPVRVQAIVAVRPTIEEMLAEMRRSKAETAAMLAMLPPELVARKGSYVRLGRGLMQLTLAHVHEHAAQIREAIQAARG